MKGGNDPPHEPEKPVAIAAAAVVVFSETNVSALFLVPCRPLLLLYSLLYFLKRAAHVSRKIDKKLAAAVDSERERMSALKHKLEVAEDAARAATKAARAAADGEASGRRAAMELAELAREQKVRRVPRCRLSAVVPPPPGMDVFRMIG